MSEQGSNDGIQIFGGEFHSKQTVVGSGAKASMTIHANNKAQHPDQEKKAAISVLLVTANPKDLERVQPGVEERAIRQALQISHYRESIKLDVCPEATINDLRRALLNKPYQIVHIAGHGLPEGILLTDEQGYSQIVRAPVLASLFKTYIQTLQCIVLNACYSLKPGRQIALGVRRTIAIEGALNDKAAIEFARGFYDALGAGKEIEIAYEEGCRAVNTVLPDIPFASHLFTANY